MGGTLVQSEGTVDAWRPAVLEAIEGDFGRRWWAEPLYDADIRRPPKDEPHRQETSRWPAERMRPNGEGIATVEGESVRSGLPRPPALPDAQPPPAPAAPRRCQDPPHAA